MILLIGYSNHLSVAPGMKIEFKVSSSDRQPYIDKPTAHCPSETSGQINYIKTDLEGFQNLLGL